MPSPFSSLMLASAAAPNSGLGAFLSSGILPMVLIFVIFYVVLMLPMQRQRKALAQMIANLKKGDKVITNGGIYGEVVSVDTNTVIVRIADNVRVKMAKSAISGLETLESDKDKGSQS